MALPERIRALDIDVGGTHAGQLQRASQYIFSYRRDDPSQASVGLLMPPAQLAYQDNALFPVMDQNLPEGYLFARIREAFPKQPLTPMHLLALMGDNAIGRVGYRLPDRDPPRVRKTVAKADILRSPASDELFESLVQAYLSTGIGLSGVQPKIMVPDERATLPIPNLIVKAGSPAYPGLAANEFLCLSVARRAGIGVENFELSDSGELLVVERFDLLPGGERLGFEDMAAVLGLQVHDIHHGERKYVGSYERIAMALRTIRLPPAELAKFFEQLTLSIMVRNGDAHLKNFGVLYSSSDDVRLSPLFDVVTTSIYPYARVPVGPPMEDHTMALKMFGGRHASKMYPSTEELLRFGKDVCGVAKPESVVERIAAAMDETLSAAAGDERIPRATLEQMRQAWQYGLAHRSELRTSTATRPSRGRSRSARASPS